MNTNGFAIVIIGAHSVIGFIATAGFIPNGPPGCVRS